MGYNFTNKAGVSLAIAPFLALDTYQYDPDPRAVSVTTLIKPIRMLVLIKRNQDLQKEVDLIEMAASSMGSAYHARLEQAWSNPELLRSVFHSFGYTDDQLARVVINPTDDAVMAPDVVPVYTEKRFYKEVAGWKLTGQADLILNGWLHDFKSSSVWGYIFDSNAEDYVAQGSIYRWLSDGIIKGDQLYIEYLFTDWSQQEAHRKKEDYPQLRVMQKEYNLWSLDQTEKYVIDKLRRLDDLYDMDQSLLPKCTKEDLWQSDTVYKYFKNPSSKRATKNCDSYTEAQALVDKKGGIVKTVPGQVKRCNYCNVVDICEQAKDLQKQRLLIR